MGSESKPHAQTAIASVEIQRETDRAEIDGCVLNLKHLDTYTSGNRSLEVELLGLFRLQLDQQRDALVNAETRDDWVMASHTLKGSSRGVGADGVAAEAERLEHMEFDPLKENRLAAVSLLDIAVAECHEVIERLLGN